MTDTPYNLVACPLAGLSTLSRRPAEPKSSEQVKRIKALEVQAAYLQTKLTVAQLTLQALGITFI